MNRILTIAWKNVYTTYRDRNTLLITLVTPLALSLIIGLAFGGSGNGPTLSDIPVALVNLDNGNEQNGQTFNYGQTFTDVLLPSSATSATSTASCGTPNDTTNNTSLDTLLNVQAFTTAEEAKAAVNKGDFAAAIIIPANFSARLSTLNNTSPDAIEPITIEVYGSGASPISASVVRSVTESIANQFVTGNIAIGATISTLVTRAQTDLLFGASFLALSQTNEWQPDFACAFVPSTDGVQIVREPINQVQTQSNFVIILITIGIAQSIFFAFFNAEFSFLAIYDERKLGTLPRIAVAPISRASIFSGFVLGVFASVLVQLSLLMLLLTTIASLIERKLQFIWGSNLPLLMVMLIAMTVSVCAVGLLIVSIARSAQQAQVIGSVINVFMAALGGTFGFSLPQEFGVFSPIWWSKDALYKLSNNNFDVGLNIFVLLGIGGVLFALALWLFNRQDLVS